MPIGFVCLFKVNRGQDIDESSVNTDNKAYIQTSNFFIILKNYFV